MNNTKNNPTPGRQKPLKEKKMQGAQRHDLFVQWLTLLLSDDRARAVIRAMVEQHEMPVIDAATARTRRP